MGGKTDLLTSNLAMALRDLVNFAMPANNNDAIVKQQVASVVELLGVEVQKLGTDRAKDIDSLTKAQVRIMHGELATFWVEVTTLGARPPPAGLEAGRRREPCAAPGARAPGQAACRGRERHERRRGPCRSFRFSLFPRAVLCPLRGRCACWSHACRSPGP